MKKLIRYELQKVSIKYHFIGVLIANIFILMLTIVTSLIIKVTSKSFGMLIPAPEFSLTSIDLAVMLVRAVLIIWEAVLLAQLVVDEYRTKTITLLYTFPYNPGKIIVAKFFAIYMIMLLFYGISYIFQNLFIKAISIINDNVSYSFNFGINQILIIISCIGLGFMPVYFGMIKMSTIATIVTALIVVGITSSSQGNVPGILSIPVVAIVLGVIGILTAVITINKVCKNDLLL
ncbi:MAG: ABC transporter permease [Lachnospiraceae bacterium]|nr:ABC transporter permease [Lachnospiraceae bacterium]